MVMTNFEARIRTYQPNLFLDFTKEHPDTKISYWMTDISFVVVFESNNARDIEDADGIGFCCPPLHRSKQCCQLEVIFRVDHTNQDNINEIITSSGAWYVQPVVIEKGWEYFTVYSVSRGSIESIVKRLRDAGGEAELLSIREVSIRDISNNALLPASTLYQDFTARAVGTSSIGLQGGLLRPACPYHRRPSGGEGGTIPFHIGRTPAQSGVQTPQERLARHAREHEMMIGLQSPLPMSIIRSRGTRAFWMILIGQLDAGLKTLEAVMDLLERYHLHGGTDCARDGIEPLSRYLLAPNGMSAPPR